MRTEEEIRERIGYEKGYLDAILIYCAIDKEPKDKEETYKKAVINTLKWVLESEGSDE